MIDTLIGSKSKCIKLFIKIDWRTRDYENEVFCYKSGINSPSDHLGRDSNTYFFESRFWNYHKKQKLKYYINYISLNWISRRYLRDKTNLLT